MPDAPLVVVWRVTEACDLPCWFCEYSRMLHRPRRAARADDVLAFGAVLARYAQHSGRRVLVSWLGGEPLVWPALVEVGQRFRRDYGLALGLTTNGARLDQPSLVDHLAENYAEVTFSIDGQAAAHEAGRGAPGLFERLRLAIQHLAALKFQLGYGPTRRVNTILMHSNLHDFEGLGATLAGWGVEALTFNALGGRPPGPLYASERLTPEDVAWLGASLPGQRQRLAGQGLALLGSEPYLRRLASSAAGQAQPVRDCHPGASFLFVDAAGRAAPCAFTGAALGVPIHEIQSPADVEQLAGRFAHRRESRLPLACGDCHSTQVFGKFQPAEAL